MSVRCRTCGEVICNLNATNLFEDESNALLHKIESLTGIWLINDQDMPNHICAYCLQDLNHAVEFRERCLKTHRFFLRNRHKTSNMDDTEDPLNSTNLSEDASLFVHININPTDDVDSTEFIDSKSEPEPESHCLGSKNPKVKIKHQVTTQVPIPQPIPKKKSTVKKIAHSKVQKEAADSRKVSSGNSSSKPNRKKKWLALNEQEIIELQRKMRRKDFVCDQCGRHFTENGNLKKHLLRHTGVKEFECQECDHKAYTLHLLNLHVRVRHKGEKPYACKFCDERFHTSTTRCRHEQRIHMKQSLASQRSFICSYCSKAFNTKNCLKNHELVHTGERPFRCETCDVTFQRNTHLTTHYRSKLHQKRASQAFEGGATENENLEADIETDFDFHVD